MLVRQRWVHLVHGHRVHGGHLVLLLPLHPPVLEPDLDLPLRQAQGVGNLDPAGRWGGARSQLKELRTALSNSIYPAALSLNRIYIYKL